MLGCFRTRYLELRGNLEANRFTGPGMHTNLGYGPEPSREAMWDVMNSVVDVNPR
jgi:hypothetical protein